MLISHMDAVENHLLAISKVPANSGHSLNKGTPREAFIKEFLEKHLSETVSIGTGEIIDSNSKPRQSRNQFDIVIYKKNYPKIDFGGGINAFLAESVVATIEVKSVLDDAGIKQSIDAAITSKSLQQNVVRSFSTGFIPPTIQNYVVAYDGPANMSTVYGWVNNYHLQKGIQINSSSNDRLDISSPSLDGIFVLGKGFIQFDNTPISFIDDNTRTQNPGKYWIMSNNISANVLLLFILLLQATNNIQGAWLNPLPYLSNWTVNPPLLF